MLPHIAHQVLLVRSHELHLSVRVKLELDRVGKAYLDRWESGFDFYYDELHEFHMDQILSSGLKPITEDFLDTVKTSSKALDPDVERVVEEYFLDVFYRGRLVMINDTTHKRLRNLVKNQDRTEPRIRRRLRKAYNRVSLDRAKSIAITETHTFTQSMAHYLVTRDQAPVERGWITVIDGRERGPLDHFNHRAMHGTVVGLNEPYEVPMRGGGTESILFPGDANASPANRLNCRCTQFYRLGA